MSVVTEKTCPYCKKILKVEDELVICDKCKLIHHKSCWESHDGCEGFGCMGNMQIFTGDLSEEGNPEQPTLTHHVKDDEAAPVSQAAKQVEVAENKVEKTEKTEKVESGTGFKIEDHEMLVPHNPDQSMLNAIIRSGITPKLVCNSLGEVELVIDKSIVGL